MDRADVARNRDEAAPIYAELQRILRDEQPWTFLYYFSDLVVLRDRLQNVQMDIRGALVNVHEWWVTDAREPAPERGDSAARSPGPAAAPAR
jgi:peptide/nickel transport system substrate-binding protein